MADNHGSQNQNLNPSLEDEQRLRDKTYELYHEMELLQNKPVRNVQEEKRYRTLKAQYNALYEEYEGKYAIVMEADKRETPAEEPTKSSKLFKTLLIGVIALVLLVIAVVVLESLKRMDENNVIDLTNEYVKWDGAPTVIGDGYKIAVEEDEDSDANVLEEDKRVPDLAEVQNMDQLPERRHFAWKSIDGSTELTWNPQIYKETFEAYREAERYLKSDEFYRYLSDPNNERLLLEIAHTLQSIGEGMGYSDWELVCEAVNFVQNIPFVEDKESTGHEEWPKYVTEIVYDECGDCEDKAILLAGILKSMDFDAVLIAFDGHLGVGISGADSIVGTNYEYNGKKYYYIEPSYPGWQIGQFPNNIDAGQVAIVPI